MSADDLTHTGSGGNPKLNPLISTNFDSAIEWYFAPRGLLSAGVYDMDLKNYINFGNQERMFKDLQASKTAGMDVYSNYLISVPTNVNGKIKGVELNYIQPIGKNFGVAANYTYAAGHARRRQAAAGHLEEDLQRVGLLRERRASMPASATPTARRSLRASAAPKRTSSPVSATCPPRSATRSPTGCRCRSTR